MALASAYAKDRFALTNVIEPSSAIDEVIDRVIG